MRRYLLWLLYLCIGIVPIMAQNADWEVVVFEPALVGNPPALYQVNAAGVTPLPLPDTLATLGMDVQIVAVAHNHTKAVVIADQQLYMLNIADNTCCVPIMVDIGQRIWSVNSGFNVDDTRLVMAAISPDPFSGLEGMIVLLDTVQNSVITTMIVGDTQHPVISLGGWRGNAFLLLTSTPCTEVCGVGYYDAMYLSADGGGTEPSPYQNVPFGSQLFSTLEIVQASSDPNFPIPQYMTSNNVVTVLANDTTTLIHHDPNNAYAPVVFAWVADGQAVRAGRVLIWRSGARYRVEENVANILAGTPDGWLSQSEAETGEFLLRHVIAHENGVELQDLGTFKTRLNVLIAPQLGASLGAIPTPFAPLANPDEPLVCPNSLPPRLIMEQSAIVAPDVTVELYAKATFNASVQTTLSAGSRITVDNGLVCADGATWWHGYTNETDGWFIESQDGQYLWELAN